MRNIFDDCTHRIAKGNWNDPSFLEQLGNRNAVYWDGKGWERNAYR